ncbi:hypothetical protein [uncultured Roseobacter sp.]|uniref:hypothetical protein n=1 Tax=uncultured Roseobacter sp. TaxID=114847 RepID=UPI0026022D93|nr:hypothetical protein [uncultured Roseobacter sp.]
MSWEETSIEDWTEIISDAFDQLDDPVGLSLARFNLIPLGFEGSCLTHSGSLRVDGDFTPSSRATAIFGDLEVSGRISTEEVDGGDGNATLLVLGRLTCKTLVNDWASLILVSQDVVVSEWALASREDSSFVVGGDFSTPLFVGYDIPVTVRGDANIKAGIGYAMKMDAKGDDDFDRRTLPELDSEATERVLKLGPDDWLDDRFYETGTILPQD